MVKQKKIAVVLMNLGGPSNINEVKPFLFRLFFDKRIICLPLILRWIVAKLIATLRYKKAINIYKKIGGKSPIYQNTEKQKNKLSKILSTQNADFKVFIAMRYSFPFTQDTMLEIKNYMPDEIILLPLYPHFSTTTTLSSFEVFEEEKNKYQELLRIKTKKICCYYDDKGFIASQVNMIKKEIKKNKLRRNKIRILFSAHSLPCSVIEKGDSYQWQIEKNVEFIMKDKFLKEIDHAICYQSKVGYNKWLSPSTEDEIKKAAKDGIGVVIVPISFVSEHSETLVEMDIDYKAMAKKYQISKFVRVKTQGDDNIFIESLSSLCLKSFIHKKVFSKIKTCPHKFCFCINNYNG